MRHTRAQASRQHFIPCFILREFADVNGRVWCTRTDGKPGKPFKVHIIKVFVEKHLYTVIDEYGSRSDLNEQMLARMEGRWERALNRIKKLVAEELEDRIQEADAWLALEYYLNAGCRTPEHLNWVMHGGEYKPREVIRKVFGPERDLSETDFHNLENNIRATLGSGQADPVKQSIKALRYTLGLGIYKLNPGTEHFIIGSYGAVQNHQEMYFVPVAPDMALFCTNRPESLVVTRQGKDGDETRQKMNIAMWNKSRWVGAASAALLKDVEKQAA